MNDVGAAEGSEAGRGVGHGVAGAPDLRRAKRVAWEIVASTLGEVTELAAVTSRTEVLAQSDETPLLTSVGRISGVETQVRLMAAKRKRRARNPKIGIRLLQSMKANGAASRYKTVALHTLP